MPDVLVVLAPGAEETETITVADVLVRAGCQVLLASAEGDTVTGSRGLPLTGHRRLDEVLERDFDCVYLPGGKGAAEYCSTDPRIQDLIERQLRSERLLAIICASPTALLPRELARGRALTCYPSFREELERQATWHDRAVVEDGNLITSQGPGTALQLGLCLARRLVSEQRADEVAAAMLVVSAH